MVFSECGETIPLQPFGKVRFEIRAGKTMGGMWKKDEQRLP
jgi:hypothetical protein